jgi:hypothetical protein
MRYEEFRDHLQNALCEAGLFLLSAVSATETIDLARTSRRWEGDIGRAALPEAEPFHVSAKVTFDWSAVNAARASTCEEGSPWQDPAFVGNHESSGKAIHINEGEKASTEISVIASKP